jgi:hypothetical protein
MLRIVAALAGLALAHGTPRSLLENQYEDALEHSAIAWSFDDIEVGQMPKAYSEKEVARRNHRRAQTGPPPIHLGFNPALVWNERMFFLLNNYHDAMPHSYVWLLSPPARICGPHFLRNPCTHTDGG